MANIGFVGLGIMGKPMAANLIKGGHSLQLYTLEGVAQELPDDLALKLDAQHQLLPAGSTA